MKIGIIQYPGSNCMEETIRYFETRKNYVVKIWHKENYFEPYKSLNLLVIPGGFAFGDRYYEKATHEYTVSPGQMAKESPVSKIILECHANKIPILGICNGFQILLQLNLLPGKLCRNTNHRFNCTNVACDFHSSLAEGLSSDDCNVLNVANGYGNYQCSNEEYEDMLNNDQILITYREQPHTTSKYKYNVLNGSKYNIGAIMNKDKTIIGMMPHPERSINHGYIFNFYQIIFRFMIRDPLIIKLTENIERLMSSEHISYKSTKKYLKNLYSKGEHVVIGPGENAGVVDIGDGYCLAIRIESHNHPTFIDPYNGAATGVGGILRDIFTMGARPIGILDFLRFGTDENSEKLLKNAVKGISDYGNCFGVANIGGSCYVDESYNKNPLVNVAAIGILKKENLIRGNVKDINDKLIYVGAKTGIDGIGGAAMASQTFKENTNMKELKKNIQVGDPFLEKLLLEACLEIAEKKLAVGMQDLGAGGLLCASLEVVLRGRKWYQQQDKGRPEMPFGCVIESDKIPTKCEGMDVSDKLISESQERMLIVVTEQNLEKVYEIFNKWDLEYECIGTVTNDSNYTVKSNGEIVFQKNIKLFGEYEEDHGDSWGCIGKAYDKLTDLGKTTYDNNLIKLTHDLKKKDLDEFSSYDSTIGNRTYFNGRNIIQESCINLPEVNKSLKVIWGSSLKECYKNYQSIGDADNLKILGYINCLNYGDPHICNDELGMFLYHTNEFAKEIKCPVLGGNVSLYNSTSGRGIYNSPVIVMICIWDN